jgi:hypothetical protein
LNEALLDRVVRLQNGLVARATGGQFAGGDAEYGSLRRDILGDTMLAAMAPSFIRRCGDLAQFWGFIKHERSSYQERRDLIWTAFRPLIEHLESKDRSAGDDSVAGALRRFGADAVQSTWQKALTRRTSDPEGAATLARTLLESVCKHVLDDCGVFYGDAEIPKLWALTSEQLNLLPSQHDEEAFRRILGNCQAVVDGIANVRNRVGDPHGRGRRQVRITARHAELAVNLAGAMASFVLNTWLERASGAAGPQVVTRKHDGTRRVDKTCS